MIEVHPDITVIDCHYIFDKIAASFLVTENGRALFIENNTSRALPFLLRALSDKGLTGRQVDYLMITHLHLDHAGGTHALLGQCPQAMVIAHPRARRHLMNPARLVQGVKAVYGEKKFSEFYGEVRPIPGERIRTVDDGESLRWGGKLFRFLHTKGHASHHMVIHEDKNNCVFTGDAFGLAYPALQGKEGLFIIPALAPPEFDLELALQGIRKIADTGARFAYLTHFGVVDVQEGTRELIRQLEVISSLLKEASTSGFNEKELNLFFEGALMKIYSSHLEKNQVMLTDRIRELLKLDVRLNSRGLTYTVMKSMAKEGKISGNH